MEMPWKRRRRERLEQQVAAEAEAEFVRFERKLLREDVTVFGEQLAELHIDTLTTPLSGDLARDYQAALDIYDELKASTRAISTRNAVLRTAAQVEDGRFRIACVLARQAGEALPERLPSCFFNPQHGISVKEMMWKPNSGVERLVPVCGSDARRLEAHEAPDVRLVRIGDRMVAWFDQDNARKLLNGGHSFRDEIANTKRETDIALAKGLHRAGEPFGPGSSGGLGGPAGGSF